MKNNQISVRATIDFMFSTEPDLTISELLDELEERIRMGEFFPHHVIRMSIETDEQIK